MRAGAELHRRVFSDPGRDAVKEFRGRSDFSMFDAAVGGACLGAKAHPRGFFALLVAMRPWVGRASQRLGNLAADPSKGRRATHPPSRVTVSTNPSSGTPALWPGRSSSERCGELRSATGVDMRRPVCRCGARRARWRGGAPGSPTSRAKDEGRISSAASSGSRRAPNPRAVVPCEVNRE